MTGVAGAKVIKDSTLDWMALPTSKAFPESRPRCLISLALPDTTQFDNIAVHVQQRAYIQTAENDLGQCVTTANSGCHGVFCWLTVISCVGAGKPITWRNSLMMLLQLFAWMSKSKPKIDFLMVHGIVTSVGCNARSSPAVQCMWSYVFNSSVRSRVTIKIITFYQT